MGIPAFFDSFKVLPAGDGKVYLAPQLQGRIFASLDGEVLHRFDAELAAHPLPDDFNNLGGNSLWPAPEGGEFAFNYPADGSPWRVQAGINSAVSQLSADGTAMSRTIALENRKGVRSEVLHRREVAPRPGFGKEYGLREVVYSCRDTLRLTFPLPADSFLVSSWSLEQFDLGKNITAFGTLGPGAKLNGDFYGDIAPNTRYVPGGFVFKLAGEEKLQIGVPESAGCTMIGAWLPERELVILRRIADCGAGRRINFADNDQKDGVFSAADAYSVFYGAGAKFFELETLAPVQFDEALRTTGSVLESETHFYRGSRRQIAAMLKARFNFDLDMIY